jgi:hypothetical protein
MFAQELEIILEKYIQWLNMWNQASDIQSDHVYTTEQFRVYDQERSLYGTSGVTGVDLSGHYAVLHVAASDGDDGGPAYLTAWMTDERKLVHLVQEFDTYVQSIFDATTDPKGEDQWLSKP